MTIEERLQNIKNRMTDEWFNNAFQYKRSIEDFCKQWENYYSRFDRENSLKEKFQKEYIWKPYEKFYVHFTEFDKKKYEIFYCGMKDKKKFVSINKQIFELNSEFKKNVEDHFKIPNIGIVLYGSVKFALKDSHVRAIDKLFKKLP